MGGICAVIAEYDPFHNGHAFHLAETRRRTNADHIVVLLSGYISQRGGLCLFSPADRARMALMNGADLVLSMPCTCSARDAENYAFGAVQLLCGMGIVDQLSFGSELDDLPALQRTAAALESPALQAQIGQQIREGSSYPRAVQMTLEKEAILPPGAIGMPNVILAVSYLRALLRLKGDLSPVLVKRSGAYHADGIDAAFPSAGALRRGFLVGGESMLRPALPESAYRIAALARQENRYSSPALSDAVLFSLLSRTTPEALRQVPGVTEGIENRILAAANRSCSREQLLKESCTPRFTRARINRILCHLMLDTHPSDFSLPPFVRVLGFQKKAAGLLREIRRSLPCVQDMKELESDGLSPVEVRAARLWTVCSGRPIASLYREKPVIL